MGSPTLPAGPAGCVEYVETTLGARRWLTTTEGCTQTLPWAPGTSQALLCQGSSSAVFHTTDGKPGGLPHGGCMAPGEGARGACALACVPEE